MKISTAIFASILSLCLTVSYVSGQIQFADGTVQTTAYDPPSVTAADRFSFAENGTIISLPILGMTLSPVVPAGQELVILQINTFDAIGNIYTSRLQSPDELTNPIDIAWPLVPDSNGGFSDQSILNFPDGTVVIDEGRQLWGGSGTSLYACSVLGYYRDK